MPDLEPFRMTEQVVAADAWTIPGTEINKSLRVIARNTEDKPNDFTYAVEMENSPGTWVAFNAPTSQVSGLLKSIYQAGLLAGRNTGVDADRQRVLGLIEIARAGDFMIGLEGLIEKIKSGERPEPPEVKQPDWSEPPK